jgi:hypothetical protein
MNEFARALGLGNNLGAGALGGLAAAQQAAYDPYMGLGISAHEYARARIREEVAKQKEIQQHQQQQALLLLTGEDE